MICMEQNMLIKQILERGVDTITVKKSIKEKLSSGKRLRVKLGVDPTSPRIHLGHAVVLRKLRQFQEAGHVAIFLVGDFTARIGDPTDKLSARQPLADDEIKKNMELYKEQAGKILNLDAVELRFNSEWHIAMDFRELFEVMSRFTVNQMIERNLFERRLQKEKPLWIHELMYPILQAYDSVALQADIELGGTDQTFNMLQARTLQPFYQQAPQDIMTMPLIPGTDGTEKMSKSVGNTIDILDSPDNMFGKIMSIPDSLIIDYFRLLTDVPDKQIAVHQADMVQGANPRDLKFSLASAIVTDLHDAAAADAAGKEFERVFQQKKKPTDMPTYPLPRAGEYGVVDILTETKIAQSNGQARRLVEQGAVRIDDEKVTDWQAQIHIEPGTVLQAGKRKFIRFTGQ